MEKDFVVCLTWRCVEYASRNQFHAILHIWAEYLWKISPGVNFSDVMNQTLRLLKYAFRNPFTSIVCIWTEYCWNIAPRVDSKLFYASELNSVEIWLQDSVLRYFIHLSRIFVKYVSRSQFWRTLPSELNIVEILVHESILSDFMNLSWIFVKNVSRTRFWHNLYIWT